MRALPKPSFLPFRAFFVTLKNMHEYWVTAIGAVAATLATISFLPQVLKSWKTRHTKDISFWMYLLFVLGIMLWILYGFLRRDMPVLIGNVVTLVLAGSILILKIKNNEIV